jgi:hypothetical protein
VLAFLVVRRGFGDVVEAGFATSDFGDDVFGVGGPNEGFGIVVPELGPGVDGGGRFAGGGEAGVGEHSSGEDLEPDFDQVEP